ncbi:hypothetical protein ACJX0J_003350 (mitochondrion) [Zea mays]
MTTEQADQEVVVLKIKISVKWQSSDSERKGMWKKQLSFFIILFRFVNKSLKGPDLSLVYGTQKFLHVWSFVWIQSAKPTLLTILCALANWARLLTDWINRISKLSSYDFRLISLLIEYLDKQAWTNRISYSWNDGKDYLFPVDELGKERSQGISLSFQMKNSFDNVFLFHSIRYRDARLGLLETLWACKDKVDISSIGIERTWFMERIGGGHFHFNVAVGENIILAFLALVNAQYLFNEEMNNRKSTILQIENVWCQRI